MPRDDELIKKDVVDQLYWDDRVDASEVAVNVKDGTVTLKGTVPTYLAWESTLEGARSVPGVREIIDELDIDYPEPGVVPTDVELLETARSVLVWSPDIDASDMTVTAEGGMVTLQGTVDAYWKKFHAEEAISRLNGVLYIENDLAVVPTDDFLDKRIAEEITSALDRNVLIDDNRVNVRVENGVVELTGTVPSWAAERAAYEAALYTSGVIDVQDNLVIEAA